VFAVMGVVPMYLAVRGWFSRDDETAGERAAGLAAYAQLTSGSEWRGRS
jgi:hypothetical protein